MIKARLDEFLADRKGGVIIYVALALPVLVGGMGLGAESGYRYHNQRLLQHAADFAAHTGAVRKYKGDEKAEIDAAAMHVAVNSEFDASLGTITVNIPPASGAFTGNPTAVEVILAETRPRLFSAIFSEEPVLIGARAVAAVTSLGQPACILALSGTAPAAAKITGSTSVNLAGCSIASNSTAANSFDMQGLGGSLSADCVQTSGGSETTGNLTLTECDAVLEYAPPVADPYIWVMEPDTSVIPCRTGPGANGKVGNPNQTNTVGTTHTWNHPTGPVPVTRFCSGLDAKGIVTFEPGLYIIEGGNFTAGGGTAPALIGDGVTFYFTNGGAARINGGAQLNLSAPDSGPFSGILFFGGRSDPEDHIIQGNSTSVLTGAVYMPASEVTFTGNSTSGGGCTQVIANTVVMTGNSDLAVECEDDGTKEILIGQLISVVE